jgi:hypothetical protein
LKPEPSIRTLIEKAVTKHPATVGQLARQVQAENAVDELEFLETVKSMVHDKAIVLEGPSYDIETVLDYLFTITLSGWFWATLAVTAVSLIVVAVTPDVFPVNVPRWVLGSIFVLFLPGYSLLQLLFPKGPELDSLERFALDIGISLAVVPLIGLMLNFTPWGIRLIPIVISLAGFTVIASMGAALRKYWAVRTYPE